MAFQLDAPVIPSAGAAGRKDTLKGIAGNRQEMSCVRSRTTKPAIVVGHMPVNVAIATGWTMSRETNKEA